MTHDTEKLAESLFKGANLVYVRPLAMDELENILPANAIEQLDVNDDLFAVHDADGNRLAIIEGRDAAFAAAEAHELQPTSLH